jgi:hypothetical protein
VSFSGTRIEGILSARGGKFAKPTKAYKPALDLSGISVGDLLLRDKFSAKGGVDLISATVRGDFSCRQASIQKSKREGDALNAQGINVAGRVLLRNGFSLKGRACFLLAKIGDQFVWSAQAPQDDATLDLQGCSAGAVEFIGTRPAKMALQGFTYHTIDLGQLTLPTPEPDDDDKLPNRCSIWLKSQADFSSQPFVQLADTLKHDGKSSEANQVLVLMESERTKNAPWHARPFNWLYYNLARYGYEPARAVGWWFGFLTCGTVLFWIANWLGWIKPSGDDGDLIFMTPNGPIVGEQSRSAGINRAYPRFSAFRLSLDALTPVINFYQRDYWCPTCFNFGAAPLKAVLISRFIYYYFLFHILSGWVITTVLVIALSGLIHQ